MTNYITAQEFVDITGVTGDQCGETIGSTEIRDKAITDAQREVLKELDRSTISALDDDYALVQSAIAYLAAHKISMRMQPLSITNIVSSPYKDEYKRIAGLLKTGESAFRQPTFPSDGGVDNVTLDDID